MYNWFGYVNLKKENARLRRELGSIAQDGTEEHNAAVKLRQENARLNVQVLRLNHLNQENVSLIERLDQEIKKSENLELLVNALYKVIEGAKQTIQDLKTANNSTNLIQNDDI